MKNKFFKLSILTVILFGYFSLPIHTVFCKNMWHKNSKGIWYETEDKNGNYTYFTDGWKVIDGKSYYFDNEGYVLIGKHEINGKFYYFNDSKGYREENKWVGDYYFGIDGVMLIDAITPDGYRVGKDGRWLTNRWVEYTDHWEYMYSNGSIAKNKFEKIYGKTYYFDEKGYMVTGWKNINDKWYYFKDSGMMLINAWQGSYYLGLDGVMLVDTNTPDGYRVDKDGKYIPNRWVEYTDHWEYMYSNGSIAKNKFEKIYGKTYYFDEKGYMVTGWKNIKGNWYYFKDSGMMLTNDWQGSYYLGSDGVMLVDTITPDGYKVNKQGACVGGNWKMYYRWWYQYDDGTYPVDCWRKIDGSWYCFDSEGYLFTNTITPDGYRVDGNGRISNSSWYLNNGVLTAGNIKSKVGNNFVVVSISEQKMWIVRNGDIKLETGIISGKPSTPTITGRFNIQSKEQSRYLEGEGYKSWVDYWIPFSGDYGIHDANWQYVKNFSNQKAYLTYGSRGCVNVNPSIMPDVFYYVYVGMPIVVY